MKHIILAHAGEVHNNVVESSEHALGNSGMYVLTLSVGLMILLPLILKSKMPRSNVPTIVMLAELFLAGILTYSILPVLSILSLSIGFMLSFFFVLLGLTKGD